MLRVHVAAAKALWYKTGMSALPKILMIAAGLLIKRGFRQRGKPMPRHGPFLQMTPEWKRTQRRRKPPEAGIAVPAVPPKGPLPMQGGAEAPLEFD